MNSLSRPGGLGVGGSGAKVLEGSPAPLKYPEIAWKGEKQESVIPEEVRHVVFVTGFRGTGKTSFMVGVDHPENLLFLDYESKGEAIANGAGILNYFSIMDEVAGVSEGWDPRPLEPLKRTREILAAMPKDRFTALILDNIDHLQQSALAEVQMIPTRYGLDPGKVASGQFGGAWPGVKAALSGLFSHAREKGVKVILIAAHLRDAWGKGGPIVGRFKAVGVDRIHELSVLSLVMEKPMPRYAPVPSALVQKEQLGSWTWNNALRRLDVKRRLPLKLPQATWSEVQRYLREPADFQNPAYGERPTPEEVLPYSTTFTKDQLLTLAKLANFKEDDLNIEGE